MASLIFFLLRFEMISSESVLLTMLSVGDVSSSRNISSTDAVISANLLPISTVSGRSQRADDSLVDFGGRWAFDAAGEVGIVSEKFDLVANEIDEAIETRHSFTSVNLVWKIVLKTTLEIWLSR